MIQGYKQIKMQGKSFFYESSLSFFLVISTWIPQDKNHILHIKENLDFGKKMFVQIFFCINNLTIFNIIRLNNRSIVPSFDGPIIVLIDWE